eukprot:3936975-Rhodomonas_salina.1
MVMVAWVWRRVLVEVSAVSGWLCGLVCIVLGACRWVRVLGACLCVRVSMCVSVGPSSMHILSLSSARSAHAC